MQGMRTKNHKNQITQNAAAQRSELPFNNQSAAANQKPWQPNGAPGKVVPFPTTNAPSPNTPTKTNLSSPKHENAGNKKARK